MTFWIFPSAGIKLSGYDWVVGIKHSGYDWVVENSTLLLDCGSRSSCASVFWRKTNKRRNLIVASAIFNKHFKNVENGTKPTSEIEKESKRHNMVEFQDFVACVWVLGFLIWRHFSLLKCFPVFFIWTWWISQLNRHSVPNSKLKSGLIFLFFFSRFDDLFFIRLVLYTTCSVFERFGNLS